jgi:hypothetical protein
LPHLHQRDVGSDAVPTTGRKQPLAEADMARAHLGPTEQAGRAAQRKGPNLRLQRSGLDGQVGIGQNHFQLRFPLSGVAHRLTAGMGRAEDGCGHRRCEPGKEGLDQRGGDLPTLRQFGLAGSAHLPDPRFFPRAARKVVEGRGHEPRLRLGPLAELPPEVTPALGRHEPLPLLGKQLIDNIPLGAEAPADLPHRRPPHRVGPGGGDGKSTFSLGPLPRPARAVREVAVARAPRIPVSSLGRP